MRNILFASVLIALLAGARPAQGDTIVIVYGDEDGFNAGLTADGTAIDPTSVSPEFDDATDTDTRLIGDAFGALTDFSGGAFPTFTIPVGHTITSIELEMKAGGWDSGPSPVDGAGTNVFVIDGMTVDASFLASYTTLAAPEVVETHTILLPSSFFSAFLDGSVSLAGTNLSEDSGSSSFAIDYVKLTITTVPEPSSCLLLGAVAGAAAWRRRRTGAATVAAPDRT